MERSLTAPPADGDDSGVLFMVGDTAMDLSFTAPSSEGEESAPFMIFGAVVGSRVARETRERARQGFGFISRYY